MADIACSCKKFAVGLIKMQWLLVQLSFKKKSILFRWSTLRCVLGSSSKRYVDGLRKISLPVSLNATVDPVHCSWPCLYEGERVAYHHVCLNMAAGTFLILLVVPLQCFLNRPVTDMRSEYAPNLI